MTNIQTDSGDGLHTDAILHVKDAATAEQIELLERIRKVANPHIENIRGKDYVIVDLIAVAELIQAREREAESRGRIAVISAVKDWADTTEVTYQQLMQAELDKTKLPNPQAGDGLQHPDFCQHRGCPNRRPRLQKYCLSHRGNV
jgi:hypothetical protein